MRAEERRSRLPSKIAVRGTEVILALASTASVALLWALGWLPAVERATGDLLLRLPVLRTHQSPRILAVLIDDEAVAGHGPLPWPRTLLARIVTIADGLGAEAVVLDLILSEPLGGQEDRVLAHALEATPHVVAAALDDHGSWLLPLPSFGGAAVAAHAYGEVGPDGVVRTIAATKQAEGLSLPALSLAAARLLRPELAVSPGAELRPEFRPPPLMIPSIGASAVLDGGLREDDVRGRAVFVGISATGSADQFVLPTGPAHAPVPGVLAHASATASILGGRLIQSPGRLSMSVAALLLSLSVQVLRSRRGAFDLGRFAALVVGLGVVAIVALRLGLLLLPAAGLGAAMVISALLREAIESRAAQRDSGRLLYSLLRHVGASHEGSVPRTARRRLEALRQLQARVLEGDATRRALLAGMEEGVVLWGPDGEVLEANPAALRLWGSVPTRAEMMEIMTAPGSRGEQQIHRAHRELLVSTSEIGAGRLALVRDFTAERALERRRREMQRLVSHELKTPLASISGLGETLERYELSGQEQRRVASLIRGEADRLQEMVSVFLDLERLGAGHWEGAKEAIDFGDLVGARLEVLSAAARARGQVLEPSADPGCRLLGVRRLLDRLVDNLVGNALKYSAEGDRIEVTVRRDGDRVVLEVRDHGPGIPPEAVPHLFDRFYRVPGTEGAGAGLGLSLVREVVDWHGGCTDVHSETGAGSRFVVSLPAVEED